MTPGTLAHVTQLVEAHGSDCWWTLPLEELLPEGLRHMAPKLRKVAGAWLAGCGGAGGGERGRRRGGSRRRVISMV